jgi:hypothetical protein
VKVVGDWAYLYRAVDSASETIEFMLSPKRDLPNRVHGLVTLDSFSTRLPSIGAA